MSEAAEPEPAPALDEMLVTLPGDAVRQMEQHIVDLREMNRFLTKENERLVRDYNDACRVRDIAWRQAAEGRRP